MIVMLLKVHNQLKIRGDNEAWCSVKTCPAMLHTHSASAADTPPAHSLMAGSWADIPIPSSFFLFLWSRSRFLSSKIDTTGSSNPCAADNSSGWTFFHGSIFSASAMVKSSSFSYWTFISMMPFSFSYSKYQPLVTHWPGGSWWSRLSSGATPPTGGLWLLEGGHPITSPDLRIGSHNSPLHIWRPPDLELATERWIWSAPTKHPRGHGRYLWTH